MNSKLLLTLSFSVMISACADPELDFEPSKNISDSSSDSLDTPPPRDPRFCLQMRNKSWKALTVFQIEGTLLDVFHLSPSSATRQKLNQPEIRKILENPQGLRYEATKIDLFTQACDETMRTELTSGNIQSLEDIFLCEDLTPEDRAAIQTSATALSQGSNAEYSKFLCAILATTPESISEIL